MNLRLKALVLSLNPTLTLSTKQLIKIKDWFENGLPSRFLTLKFCKLSQFFSHFQFNYQLVFLNFEIPLPFTIPSPPSFEPYLGKNHAPTGLTQTSGAIMNILVPKVVESMKCRATNQSYVIAFITSYVSSSQSYDPQVLYIVHKCLQA